MKQTRIALVGMSRIMTEMIELFLASQPDLKIAARIRGTDRLRPAQLRNIDVVISVVSDTAVPEIELDHYLPQHRRKVLGIGEDGTRGVMCVLRPHRTIINELSSESLIAAIREEP